MRSDDLVEDRRFGPTSGVAIGCIGLAGCAVGAVAALKADTSSVGIGRALVAALVAVLVWCFMLRPRVVIGPDTLVLRNALSEWHVPLASIRSVVVRAITRVRTAEGKYDGVAVGRSVRAMMWEGHRDRRSVATPPPTKGPRHGDIIPDFLVEQILYAADNARDIGQAAGPVRRVWAVPELVLLGVLAVGLVIAFSV